MRIIKWSDNNELCRNTKSCRPRFDGDNWDKTFVESNKVDHRKVTFENRYGITTVGDLYIPRNSGDQKLAAIAVSGPFGAVKNNPVVFTPRLWLNRGS